MEKLKEKLKMIIINPFTSICDVSGWEMMLMMGLVAVLISTCVYYSNIRLISNSDLDLIKLFMTACLLLIRLVAVRLDRCAWVAEFVEIFIGSALYPRSLLNTPYIHTCRTPINEWILNLQLMNWYYLYIILYFVISFYPFILLRIIPQHSNLIIDLEIKGEI